MDASGKVSKTSGEISMVEGHRKENDLIINIPADEHDSNFLVPSSSTDQKFKISADSPHRVSNDSALSARKSVTVSFPSPENIRFGPSPNKPPKIPESGTLTRRISLSKSIYSKPKSRFGEQSVPIDGKILEEDEALVDSRIISSHSSPNTKVDVNNASTRTLPITPKTPLMASPGRFEGVDEDEEIYKKVSSRRKLKYRKVKTKVLVEWFLFLCILGCLIASLVVDKLQQWMVWGLQVWKWCALVLVTFSGMLVTKLMMHFVVLLIELNFLLKKKVLYFVYGLKKSVQVCVWLSVVLLTWVFLFQEGERFHKAHRILDFITWTIASILIGSFLWLLKTLLLKILASSFHVNTFFDRIQEAMFHQYILFTLSGPPVMESEAMLGRTNSNVTQFSFRVSKKGKGGKEKKEKEVIDMSKLHRMKQEKVSAWTVKMLVDVISNSGLTTLSNAIDESAYDGGNEQADKEITNEEEAIAAAYHIFWNVAPAGSKRFMIKEEVDVVFPMIDVAETGQIDRKVLTEWVVKVYKGRKALAHALNDTKTAVKQLNKIVTGIVIIIMILVWFLLVGIATTKVLVFLSSQLVLAVFVFGNTCKTIFEAIIFVFVMHPFDVGDRCVIDGVQMIVEEMNILTTVFLKFDKEKIFYPNSVLATKPISNFYRSPDMSDQLEFSIDFRTPVEKIGALKDKMQRYIEKNPQLWYPNHSVIVKEIENVNKLKMALIFNHTMNFQEFGEKNKRKSELVLEMKRIFEELAIGYYLLPQEVHLIESKNSN
ncbi:mechanosensitive ion channel protein 10-like isoform X2 [Henckelia pumila]|uniref:mechanosensitive ion channel protein 10-like isoform X2 n=1 Tax=Henckelia pumila TaxID=405737 RepID=UPI003C6E2FB1